MTHARNENRDPYIAINYDKLLREFKKWFITQCDS